jgi:glutaminyl-peptide cyclotransferase
VAMKNILAKFPGKSGKAIVVTGHFDTKYFASGKFVGASDGGSSTGLLLELAQVLQGQKRADDVYIVFFDGEEAVGDWSDTDSLYGSRHLAERWKKDGMLYKIKALINVDMIGDKNLNVQPDMNSTAVLRRLVWKAAADLGYASSFPNDPLTIDDDHMPFIKLGVPSVDLIDFDYQAWHKEDDTMDKLSAKSLEIVGAVVVEVIARLERQRTLKQSGERLCFSGRCCLPGCSSRNIFRPCGAYTFLMTWRVITILWSTRHSRV